MEDSNSNGKLIDNGDIQRHKSTLQILALSFNVVLGAIYWGYI